jgi:hypothetical protein
VVPSEIVIGSPTDVREPSPASLPEKVVLKQNYPNPFNTSTVIDWQHDASGPIRLEVFNVLGQRVADLVSGLQAAGSYSTIFAGLSEDGRPLPSGIYFYRLRAGRTSLVRKMVLVK